MNLTTALWLLLLALIGTIILMLLGPEPNARPEPEPIPVWVTQPRN